MVYSENKMKQHEKLREQNYDFFLRVGEIAKSFY
jgi:hypothetical protein